tara:strand:- start:25103 stop:25870 length:768 start_codon:yes stop_codon:yes gene_type:complete
MIAIDAGALSASTRAFAGDMDRIKKQIPFATALALTWTGKKLKENVQSVMRQRLDRPKAFTLNSVFLKPASKKSLVAKVWFKDWIPKGTAADKYMRPAVFGGARRHKRSETAFIARGIMKPNQFFVPAAGAKIDAYGNMRKGQITQILSGLGAFSEMGYMANATRSRRSKRKRNANKYFVGHPGDRHGSDVSGVWERKRIGTGATGIRPVLLFVDSAPKYRVRVPFFKIAENTKNAHIKKNFEAALKRAIEMPRR